MQFNLFPAHVSTIAPPPPPKKQGGLRLTRPEMETVKSYLQGLTPQQQDYVLPRVLDAVMEQRLSRINPYVLEELSKNDRMPKRIRTLADEMAHKYEQAQNAGLMQLFSTHKPTIGTPLYQAQKNAGIFSETTIGPVPLGALENPGFLAKNDAFRRGIAEGIYENAMNLAIRVPAKIFNKWIPQTYDGQNLWLVAADMQTEKYNIGLDILYGKPAPGTQRSGAIGRQTGDIIFWLPAYLMGGEAAIAGTGAKTASVAGKATAGAGDVFGAIKYLDGGKVALNWARLGKTGAIGGGIGATKSFSHGDTLPDIAKSAGLEALFWVGTDLGLSAISLPFRRPLGEPGPISSSRLLEARGYLPLGTSTLGRQESAWGRVWGKVIDGYEGLVLDTANSQQLAPLKQALQDFRMNKSLEAAKVRSRTHSLVRSFPANVREQMGELIKDYHQNPNYTFEMLESKIGELVGTKLRKYQVRKPDGYLETVEMPENKYIAGLITKSKRDWQLTNIRASEQQIAGVLRDELQSGGMNLLDERSFDYFYNGYFPAEFQKPEFKGLRNALYNWIRGKRPDNISGESLTGSWGDFRRLDAYTVETRDPRAFGGDPIIYRFANTEQGRLDAEDMVRFWNGTADDVTQTAPWGYVDPTIEQLRGLDTWVTADPKANWVENFTKHKELAETTKGEPVRFGYEADNPLLAMRRQEALREKLRKTPVGKKPELEPHERVTYEPLGGGKIRLSFNKPEAVRGENGHLQLVPGERVTKHFNSAEGAKKFLDAQIKKVAKKLNAKIDVPLTAEELAAKGNPKDPIRTMQNALIEAKKDTMFAAMSEYVARNPEMFPEVFDTLPTGEDLLKAGWTIPDTAAQLNQEVLVANGQRWMQQRLKEAYGLDFVQLADSPRKLGMLAGKWVPKSYAQLIEDAAEVSPDALSVLGNVYNRLIRTFKANVVFRNPSTHINQFIGNMKYSIYSGTSIFNPANWKYYRDGAREIWHEGPEYLRMKAMGVLDDFVHAELNLHPEGVRESLKAVIQRPELTWKVPNAIEGLGSTLEWTIRKAQDVDRAATALYAYSDNYYKMAAWMKYKGQGWSERQIAQHIFKFYPHYGRFSNIVNKLRHEHQWAVSPFLSFAIEDLRINLWAIKENPLGAAMAYGLPPLMHYASAAAMGITPEELKQLRGASPYFRPDSLYSLFLPIRDQDGFAMASYPSWIPGAESLSYQPNERRSLFENLVNSPVGQAVTPFGNPLGRTFMALATNRDPFTGQEVLDPYAGVFSASNFYKGSSYLLRNYMPPLILGNRFMQLKQAGLVPGIKREKLTSVTYDWKMPSGKIGQSSWDVYRDPSLTAIKALTGLSVYRVEPVKEALTTYNTVGYMIDDISRRMDRLENKGKKNSAEYRELEREIERQTERQMRLNEWLLELIIEPPEGEKILGQTEAFALPPPAMPEPGLSPKKQALFNVMSKPKEGE